MEIDSFNEKEVLTYEDDISAEEEAEIQGSRFQKENEHCERQKGSLRKKSQGQKEIKRISQLIEVAFYCGLFLYHHPEAGMKYSESLKKNADFSRVYETGKSYANRLLVLYVLKNDTNRNRIGISVSKKVGNSVVRHRLTRLVRESYRLHEMTFRTGYDLVVIVRPAAKGSGYADISAALMHLAGLHQMTADRNQQGVYG